MRTLLDLHGSIPSLIHVSDGRLHDIHALDLLMPEAENAVKTQIWIAVSVYDLVAIIKKRLDIGASLYTLLQILSVTQLEKMPLQQAIPGSDSSSDSIAINNQLNLFAF